MHDERARQWRGRSAAVIHLPGGFGDDHPPGDHDPPAGDHDHDHNHERRRPGRHGDGVDQSG
jgi:hypothetical protein